MQKSRTLPLVVCAVVLLAAVRGNSSLTNRSAADHRGAAGAAVRCGRRREELEAEARRGARNPNRRGVARRADATRNLYAVESADGRVERRSSAECALARSHRARTARRLGLSSKAVSQLSLPR